MLNYIGKMTPVSSTVRKREQALKLFISCPLCDMEQRLSLTSLRILSIFTSWIMKGTLNYQGGIGKCPWKIINHWYGVSMRK